MGALVLGFSVIAVCLLLPQVEGNRQVRAELDQLRAQQARLDEQVRVNEVFLAKVATDPTLITRLAQRQLRLTPEGTGTLELSGLEGDARSPFQLVSVPPVSGDVAAAGRVGGKVWGGLLDVVRDGRSRLYVMAGAFFLVALGLILDGPVKKPRATEAAGPAVGEAAQDGPEKIAGADEVDADDVAASEAAAEVEDKTAPLPAVAAA